MTTFSDFAFYQSVGGRLSESDYHAFSIRAFSEIISLTNGAAQTAPAEMETAIKLCECDMTDLLASAKSAIDFLPVGITHVTNDKLSISAAEHGGSNLTKEMRAIAVKYLQTPVNLMARWA